MKKYMLALPLMCCVSAHGQSCEYCGKWRYSGFEYANHITADCKDITHDFKGSDITIGKNFFHHTYFIVDTQKQISNVDIRKVPVDEYENAPAILVSKDNKVAQKLYCCA